MAFKNQLQTSAICNLCRKHQAEQHHKILSCNVTKNLFDRFQILLMSIFPENIYEKEMVFGLEICEKEEKYRKELRNFITFIIRSIIHKNKWTNLSGMSGEQISNRLIKLIKVELKTQIKNRYDICFEKSGLDYFRKHYLLDGIIGMIVYDKIEWSALLENI